MVIHEMTFEECNNALAQASIARLACEMDGQPYVVPVFLAYDGRDLFGFATMGYKIDCMRSNPLVCIEIDDIKSQNKWVSLVVFGSYEELPDTPQYATMRSHAHELLQRRAMWWEPACVSVEHRDCPKAVAPIFYCIHINRITGHRATPDPVEADISPAKSQGWLSRLLRPRGQKIEPGPQKTRTPLFRQHPRQFE